MADSPRRVEKPWGYEIIWAHTNRYVGKILHVGRGHCLSRQYHQVKDETLYVLTGRIRMTVEMPGSPPVVRELGAGDAIHIVPTMIHEMEALEDSDVLEASTPELGDIVRLNDRYGRA